MSTRYLASLGIVLLLVLNYTEGSDDSCCFTPEEQKAIDQFREDVKDFPFYGRTAGFVNSSLSSSFLAARDFNVEEAVKDVKDNLEWRKVNRIDDDLYRYPSFHWNDYPYYADSEDADGRPVVIAKAGDWDIRRSFLIGNQQTNISIYVLQQLEGMFDKMLKSNKATGRDISRGILIIDFFGFNLRQTGCVKCITAYIEWVTYFEIYYKGFIKNLFIINVPRIAEPIIRLLWPLLGSHTRRVVKIFGPNREEWQRALLEVIPAEQLHIEYGGTKKRLESPNQFS